VDVGGSGGGSTSSAATTTNGTTQAPASTGSTPTGGGGEGGGCATDTDEDGELSAACGGPDCDDDGDGQDSELSGCGGIDCDDEDERVLDDPTGEVVGFFTAKTAKGSWDYNCNGSDDLQYDYKPNASCATQGCENPWIEQNPGCGGDIAVLICPGSGICTNPSNTVTQRGCR
jgi:hypothetical protein